MTRPELHETLTALVEALDYAGDGPTIETARLETPMEITVAAGADAGLRFHAAPAVSRFRSGIMAPVHRVALTAERVVPEDRS